MADKEVTRAGFGPRAAAYLIDRLLLLFALGGLRSTVRLAALFGAGHPADMQLTLRNFLFQYSVLDVLCWLAAAAYFVLLTYFTGGTLGKKIMRLSVRREDGAPPRFIDVLYRETVGRFLSGILYLGYLMVLTDRSHRSFHDWLCGTCVVYEDVIFRRRERKTGPAAEALIPAYSIPGGAGAAVEAVPPSGTEEFHGEE